MIMQSSTVKFHIMFLHNYHLAFEIFTVRTLALKLILDIFKNIYLYLRYFPAHDHESVNSCMFSVKVYLLTF